MNRIDKLIIKARNAARPALKLTLAFTEKSGDSWTAVAHLWDGVPGHTGRTDTTTHATMDAAVEHIHELAKEYPNSRDVTIIIDDLG